MMTRLKALRNSKSPFITREPFPMSKWLLWSTQLQSTPTLFSGLRDLTFVCLLLDTGLRLSEALNLKLSDIDLSQGFVRVVGKGDKERFVPIGESVKVVLHRYLMRRLQVTNAGDWLFITTIATKWSKRQAQIKLSLWAKKAGIEGVRVSPHSLRFTFVRKWLQSGGDSIVLQRILGHQTTQMTSYYARLFATDLKDATSAIHRLTPLHRR
jgi:site-specific recombinase XerD